MTSQQFRQSINRLSSHLDLLIPFWEWPSPQTLQKRANMDEIIPGLWIGDLQSVKNVENLKAHGIFSILTAMRGRITIHEVPLFLCWKI